MVLLCDEVEECWIKMGIRGDMEVPFWPEMGRDKSRQIALHFFACLKDPNAFCKMQQEGNFTEIEILIFLEMIDWYQDNFITHPVTVDAF